MTCQDPFRLGHPHMSLTHKITSRFRVNAFSSDAQEFIKPFSPPHTLISFPILNKPSSKIKTWFYLRGKFYFCKSEKCKGTSIFPGLSDKAWGSTYKNKLFSASGCWWDIMTQVIPVLGFPEYPEPSCQSCVEEKVLCWWHKGLALTQPLCDTEQALPSLSFCFSVW